MHEVLPNLLWIGHALDIREPRRLFEAGIQAVVDVAYEEAPAQLPRGLIYCRFPLNDGGGNEPKLILQSLRTSTDLLRSELPTIMACSAGMSRSPTLAAFAMALLQNEDPEVCIRKIADQKPLELHPQLWADFVVAFNELDSQPLREA